MKKQLLTFKEKALKQIDEAESVSILQDIKVKYLGKKGSLTEILRGMGKLPAEERPQVGQLANEMRGAIEEAISQKKKRLEEGKMQQKLEEETIDVTLPGRPVPSGGIHPLMSVIEEIEDIFLGMGFKIAEGPEVETDYYNFEALNLPKNHPARDMQDSFYITDEILLRTQTSPVQARTMESMHGEVPVKIISPGKVFRRDTDDATHSHQFMQIEGLYVDEQVSMSELKGTLLTFAREMFGQDQQIRLRPSFFPFTEPSVEVDVSCILCQGKGCRVCKQTGWIEILGAGMVHPNVLSMSGYDPKKYTGFAFGMGPERVAMLKYGIDDIRQFYMNDMRFLKQFERM